MSATASRPSRPVGSRRTRHRWGISSPLPIEWICHRRDVPRRGQLHPLLPRPAARTRSRCSSRPSSACTSLFVPGGHHLYAFLTSGNGAGQAAGFRESSMFTIDCRPSPPPATSPPSTGLWSQTAQSLLLIILPHRRDGGIDGGRGQTDPGDGGRRATHTVRPSATSIPEARPPRPGRQRDSSPTTSPARWSASSCSHSSSSAADRSSSPRPVTDLITSFSASATVTRQRRTGPGGTRSHRRLPRDPARGAMVRDGSDVARSSRDLPGHPRPVGRHPAPAPPRPPAPAPLTPTSVAGAVASDPVGRLGPHRVLLAGRSARLGPQGGEPLRRG